MRAPAAYSALPAPTRGVILMLLCSVSYAMTFVTVRELSTTFSVYQLVLFRTAIGTAAQLPWLMGAGLGALRTGRWKLYGTRGLLVYTGNLCWFYALAHMTLADATALSFLNPLFAALILALWLRERLTPVRLAALLLGFAGAMVIIRPGFAEMTLATAAMIYTAAAYGASTAVTRGLTLTEDPNAVVFYMFAINLPLALGPGLYHWTPPAWADAGWIAAFALLSLLSQVFMTKSLALAEAAVVMPSYYMQLPLVAVFGFFLFGQVPEVWLIPGALLIVGGSYWSVWSESRRRRAAHTAANGAAAERAS